MTIFTQRYCTAERIPYNNNLYGSLTGGNVQKSFFASHKRNEEKDILQTFGCLDFRISARGADMYVYDIVTTGPHQL